MTTNLADPLVESDAAVFAGLIDRRKSVRVFRPQAVPTSLIHLYAAPVRTHLGISPEHKLLFAISLGYEDTGAAAARLDQERAELHQLVTFRG